MAARIATEWKRNMTASLYYLSPSAFVCSTKRHWFVLDVKANRYVCIDEMKIRAMSPYLSGLSGINDNVAAVPPPRDVQASIRELLNQEILVENVASGKPFLPCRNVTPTETILDRVFATPLTYFLLHAPAFYYACIRADYELRHREFRQIVESVRVDATSHGVGGKRLNLGRAGRLIAIFNALRWTYPRPYICLFDCLALLRYLQLYRHQPDWVFGITEDPFMAHCWLQFNNVVLSDTVERAASYLPIMIV